MKEVMVKITTNQVNEQGEEDIMEFVTEAKLYKRGEAVYLIYEETELSGIPGDMRVDEVTREQRQQLGALMKRLTLHIRGFRPIEEAIVTRGGVSVREIRPNTMESKLCPGLYFAGEIIDCDGYTGGFNLQIAFSTAYTAAMAVVGIV